MALFAALLYGGMGGSLAVRISTVPAPPRVFLFAHVARILVAKHSLVALRAVYGVNSTNRSIRIHASLKRSNSIYTADWIAGVKSLVKVAKHVQFSSEDAKAPEGATCEEQLHVPLHESVLALVWASMKHGCGDPPALATSHPFPEGRASVSYLQLHYTSVCILLELVLELFVAGLLAVVLNLFSDCQKCVQASLYGPNYLTYLCADSLASDGMPRQNLREKYQMKAFNWAAGCMKAVAARCYTPGP